MINWEAVFQAGREIVPYKMSTGEIHATHVIPAKQLKTEHTFDPHFLFIGKVAVLTILYTQRWRKQQKYDKGTG